MRKFIPWIVLLLAVAAAIAFREPLATWAGARWAGISGQAAEEAASGPLVASGAIEGAIWRHPRRPAGASSRSTPERATWLQPGK